VKKSVAANYPKFKAGAFDPVNERSDRFSRAAAVGSCFWITTNLKIALNLGDLYNTLKPEQQEHHKDR
jgi:hypothetical protein